MMRLARDKFLPKGLVQEIKAHFGVHNFNIKRRGVILSDQLNLQSILLYMLHGDSLLLREFPVSEIQAAK